ncbi:MULTISPECIES: MFS transporter [Paenibacillus]|uniref:MFS transporter n=1 Tax=Paenibacillus TaxID=44249 RepID=UPI0022B927C7|nr:MFS transporter [Paenibacillus caseinilyticus]MCZ8521659.1 MFS transporter [Paenibacillus caseinilyticus]
MSLPTQAASLNVSAGAAGPKPAVMRILLAISLVHLLNDTIQGIIPAILPILKSSMSLSYMQAGLIVFVLNMTSSLLQPLIGMAADRRPSPYMLPLGVAATFCGVLGLAFAPTYAMVLLSVLLIGLGSAVFHPEGSRVAYMAGGSRRGMAQSVYQVGGNSGHALASVMTALVFVPFGQLGALWFTFAAGLGILVQFYIARWYTGYLAAHPRVPGNAKGDEGRPGVKRRTAAAICVLIFLVFARSWYQSGVSIYYPFHFLEAFGIGLDRAQAYIFLFSAAGAAGTFVGGPLSDRFGRRNVIFFSMLGSAPFALLLPYAGELWAFVLLTLNGFIMMLGFSVTVVYAQELIPGKIGTVSGLIVGLAFGLGALGAVVLGSLVDALNLGTVLKGISFLPLLGLFTYFLPSDRTLKEWAEAASS